MDIISTIGAFITLIGSIFLFLGALGVIRMPDSFTRIQAGTKASTLGTILSLLGLGMINIDWIGKLFLLILFILVTNPISSHVLARSAHYINISMSKRTVIDKLRDKKSAEENESINQTKPTTNNE